jgi:PadR family transcriptional regulator, regulatory protein PadR
VTDRDSLTLLPGTLDLLVLKSLAHGRKHGYGIAEYLQRISDEILRVGESSLYPALQRLLLDGYVKAEWGTSENNRRARYYTLTASGRRQLAHQQSTFERMVQAIQLVLANA